MDNTLSLDDEEYITIRTSDDKLFELNVKSAELCTLFKTTIEMDTTITEIPVNIHSQLFEYIHRYLEYHADNDVVIPTTANLTDLKRQLDEWDYDFIFSITDVKILREILNTTNYLDIEPLLKMVCVRIATFINDIKELDSPEGKAFCEEFFTKELILTE